MGAHNAATLDVARRRTEAVRDYLRGWQNNEDQSWADLLDRALALAPGGTLKSWMQRHHGQKIKTFQTTIAISLDGKPILEVDAPWIPGTRLVDAARATRVTLDGSSRDYAGVTTFVAGDVYVGFASWGENKIQFLAYAS